MERPDFPLPTSHAHQWVLYLTARCNFSCDYCIQKGLIVPGSPRRPWARYDELSGEAWVEALNAMPVRPEHTLILTGGEPTIHPDFYSIATRLEGYKLDLTSNLSFDVDEFVRRMKSAGKTLHSSFHTYHPGFMDPETFVKKAEQLRDSGVVENPVFSLLDLDEFPHFRDEEHDANIGSFHEYASRRRLSFQRNEFRGNHMGAPFLHEQKLDMRCTSGWVNFAPNGDIHNCQYHLEVSKNRFGNVTNIEACMPIPEFGSFFRCSDFGFCDSCHENSGRGAFMDAAGKVFRRTDHDARVYLRWMDPEAIRALGRRFMDSGEPAEARHAFLVAMGKQGEEGQDADSWIDLGMSLWASGDKGKALAALVRAVELGCTEARMLASILELGREIGRSGEVRVELEKLVGQAVLSPVESAVAESLV
ncbi:MAG: radical SAM protein [Planctomycetota bacterium]